MRLGEVELGVEGADDCGSVVHALFSEGDLSEGQWTVGSGERVSTDIAPLSKLRRRRPQHLGSIPELQVIVVIAVLILPPRLPDPTLPSSTHKSLIVLRVLIAPFILLPRCSAFAQRCCCVRLRRTRGELRLRVGTHFQVKIDSSEGEEDPLDIFAEG